MFGPRHAACRRHAPNHSLDGDDITDQHDDVIRSGTASARADDRTHDRRTHDRGAADDRTLDHGKPDDRATPCGAGGSDRLRR